MPHRNLRQPLLIAAALLGFGCDAIYTDLRPEPSPSGDAGVQQSDAGPPAADAAMVTDAAPVETDAAVPATDGGAAIDAGAPEDAGAPAPAVYVGTFEGRGGYDAAGTATIRSTDSGYELSFSDDFATARVPGPAIVVTARPSIGTALTAADTVIDRISGDRFTGAQSYPVNLPELPDPLYVFIYCEPFGIETGRALLEEE